MGHVSRFAATLLLLFVLLLTTAVFASAEDPTPTSGETVISQGNLPIYDITGTDEGRRVAHAAVEHWAISYGVQSDAGQLRVYNLGATDAPDYLIVPDSIVFESASKRAVTVNEDGKQVTYLEASDAFTLDLSKLVMQPENESLNSFAPSAPYWQMVANQCYARWETGAMWFDRCYKVHKLYSDGTSTKDYFQLEHYGTAKSKFPWVLKKASLSSQKHASSSSMSWVDWSPRSDLNVGNCTTWSLSVTVQGVGIGASHELCDKWDITKYAAAGSFKNEWQGSARESEREVAYMQAISVPQNGWPVWSLTSSVSVALL